MRAQPLVVGVVALLTSIGCSEEEFDPYNRLTSLRVLGIQSDPVAPGFGETTTLAPLLYVPDGQGEPRFSWSWCPFAGEADEGFPCQVDELELEQTYPGLDLPSFDLGTEPTATFENALIPALLAGICGGVPGAPAVPNCDGGFPIQIRLRVATDSDEITAVRTMRLGFEAPSEPHTNPRIEGLAAVLDGNEQTLTDDATVTLPRDIETLIRASVSADQAEEYTGLNQDGELDSLREQLTLTWFVESGDTESERTGFISGVVPLEKASETEWTPAKVEDYGPETSRIVVVIRDDREGISSVSATVRLSPTP